jgi:hypothetical protein
MTIVPQPPKWENENWSRLGHRYWEQLFAGRLSRGPDVAALATRLTAGAATEEEKLGRIARFLQGDVRYVAIELGIGGYQPHAADEVLKNRYGDCKDKVCLLLSLLNAAGIPGEPALVRTSNDRFLDTALVDLGQFNHMIARTADGPRDLESTRRRRAARSATCRARTRPRSRSWSRPTAPGSRRRRRCSPGERAPAHGRGHARVRRPAQGPAPARGAGEAAMGTATRSAPATPTTSASSPSACCAHA